MKIEKIILAVALSAIVSCEREPISSNDRSIVLKVNEHSMTKAGGVKDLDYLKDNGFTMDIVAARAYEGGSAGRIGETRNVSWTGEAWALSPAAYWINDVQLDFWAYGNTSDCVITGPTAGATSISFTYPKPATVPDGQTDPLFAHAAKAHGASPAHDSGTESDQIELTFYHAMSKIVFDLSVIDGMPAGYSISSITVNGLKTGGVATFDGTNYTWGSLTGASSYNAAASESFIVVPQNAASATLDIRLTHATESPIMLSSTMVDYLMKAGMIYTYKIKIDASRDLDLTLASEMPWDLESRSLEIKEQAVSQALTYNEVTSFVNHTNKTVTIKNGQPVRGSFQLSSPRGAKVLLALDGNLNAFEVSPKTQIIDDNPVIFTITPLVNDPKIDYKTQLHLYLVHSDSTVSELDALVMGETDGEPNNYTIILPNQ